MGGGSVQRGWHDSSALSVEARQTGWGVGGGEEAMETEMETVRGDGEGGGSWNRGGSGTAGAGGEDAVGERKRGIRNADAAGLKYGWFSFGWAEGQDVLFDDCEPHQVNRERAAARRRMLRGGGGVGGKGGRGSDLTGERCSRRRGLVLTHFIHTAVRILYTRKRRRRRRSDYVVRTVL